MAKVTDKRVVEMNQGRLPLKLEIEGVVARVIVGCESCGCDIKAEFALNQDDGKELIEFFAACTRVIEKTLDDAEPSLIAFGPGAKGL